MKTLIGAALAVALFTACSNSPGPIQPTGSSDSLTVTPRVDTAAVGDSVQFVATASDSGSISWTISDSRVAAIMSEGAGWALVRALHPGTTTVSAARADKSAAGVLVVSSTRLAFTVQPSSTTAGVVLTPAPAVMIEDVSGQLVTGASNAVTVALALDTNASAGLLSGTTTVNAINGVATFPNLSIPKAGTGYTLTVSSSGSGHVTSVPFAITAAAPAQLLFTQQPTITSTSEPITPAITVTIQDAFGNFVAGATNAVTIAIGTNAGLGSLSGTTTVNAVSGIATFPDLSIDQPGAGYTLAASAPGLSGAASVAFNIRGPFVATAVSAGGRNSCGLTPAGAAYCWGSNASGQLGTGTTKGPQTCSVHGPRVTITVACSSTPSAVSGGLNFSSLDVAGLASFSPPGLTCGVTPAVVVYCWGYNAYGQLGDGTTTNRATPVAVTGGLSFASVSTGADHTCGVSAASTAYCWGSNASGQLGDGTTTNSPTPGAVAGGLSFVSVSAGTTNYTCGVTAAGAAYCWGSNTYGQLGDGTTTNSVTPVPVSGGLSFAAVSAGGYNTCGVTTAGAAYCWGLNSYGQLGDGTTTNSATPVAVSGGFSFAAVSAGDYHTCGVTTAGAAYCWGRNYSGQLGDGTTTNSATPVAVSGALSFAAVSAGGDHTCGVTPAGAAYCWGLNQYGQLGNGTLGSYKSVPVRVVE